MFTFMEALSAPEQEMDSKMDDILQFSELGEFIEQPCNLFDSMKEQRNSECNRTEILLTDEVLWVTHSLGIRVRLDSRKSK